MSNAEMIAAVERWDSEGGAQNAPIALVSSGDESWTLQNRHLLECLGGAVVAEWSELPTSVQRALFRHASAGLDDEGFPVKMRIAQFLRAHHQHFYPGERVN